MIKAITISPSFHSACFMPNIYLQLQCVNVRCQTVDHSRIDSTKKSNALRWRHNGRDGVSNHQPHDCLLNRLFGRISNKTSKLLVTGLCVGNSPGTGEFPAQMASNAENVSIWWRHHAIYLTQENTHSSIQLYIEKIIVSNAPTNLVSGSIDLRPIIGHVNINHFYSNVLSHEITWIRFSWRFHFSTLRSRQNNRHFADAIFKFISLNVNFWILTTISLKYVPWGLIDNFKILVQIMAWRRAGGALIFSLICTWTNGWVNYRDASDLIRHNAHYGVTVITMRNSWIDINIMMR